MTQLLAISGSLRKASGNTALLRATRDCAPPRVTVTLYEGLGQLPIFNPDLDAQPPAAVQALRERIARSDGLLIASPEYAHGVTGAIKNALLRAAYLAVGERSPITLAHVERAAFAECAALGLLVKRG